MHRLLVLNTYFIKYHKQIINKQYAQNYQLLIMCKKTDKLKAMAQNKTIIY